MALDKATQLLLRRAKAFRGLVAHPAWPDLKAQLMDDMAPLLDIRNIPDSDKAELNVKVRKLTYNTIMDWVNELETKVLTAPAEVIPKDYIFGVEE